MGRRCFLKARANVNALPLLISLPLCCGLSVAKGESLVKTNAAPQSSSSHKQRAHNARTAERRASTSPKSPEVFTPAPPVTPARARPLATSEGLQLRTETSTNAPPGTPSTFNPDPGVRQLRENNPLFRTNFDRIEKFSG